MTGMIGAVAFNAPEPDSTYPELPPAGALFRGLPKCLQFERTAKIAIFSRPEASIAVQTDRALIAYLGQPTFPSLDLDKLSDSIGQNAGEVLNRFGGLFAFCYFETMTRRLIIAADTFASYPIYYGFTDGAVYFSTDLKSLSTHGALHRKVSAQAIYDYLYFSVVPSPSTIFEGIYRVPPGHFLEINGGRHQCTRWYSPPRGAHSTVNAAHSNLREALEGSVSSCWNADVSACFLSGGLDSSTVSGLASRVSSSAVPAYSIGFPEDEYDEISYARTAAKKFSLDHRIHYVSASEIRENLANVLCAVGEPFSNASTISAYICSKRAVDDGYDNLLAGDGGDELFSGNERYLKQLKLHFFESLPNFAQASFRSAVPVLSGIPLRYIQKLSSYVQQASLPFTRRFNFSNFVEQSGPTTIFADHFLRSVDTDHPISLVQDIFDSAPFDDFVKRMLYLDWRLTLADNDLRKVRIACDLAGADVQFPMLATDVVAVSESLTGRSMMPGGKLRGFYKQAFQRFLPSTIITKPKHGFGVPVGYWMRSDEAFHSLVDDRITSLQDRMIFEPDFLAQLRMAHKTENAVHYGVILWTLMTLETWFQANNL
jgi:asparagine synthase (glutamine-hydrolysing)